MRRYIISLLVGLVLIVVGISFIWTELLSFEFTDEEIISVYQEQQRTYQFDLSDQQLYRFIEEGVRIKVEERKDVEDVILVTASYYPDFGNVSYYESYSVVPNATESFVFYHTGRSLFSGLAKFKTIFFKDLKNREFHDYRTLLEPEVTVIVPEGQKDKVQVIYDRDRMDEWFDED